MEKFRAVPAIAIFELRRIVRSSATLIVVATFPLVLMLGHSVSPAGAEDDRYFGYAYLLVMFVTLRFRLATDRDLAFDEYVVTNLTTPSAYVVGKIIAVLTYLVSFGLYAFVVAVAVSAGDLRYGAWYAVLFTLVAWVFSPLVLLVEVVLRSRTPALVVGLLYVATGTLLVGVGAGPDHLLTAFGLHVEAYRPSTLQPLAVRAVLAVPTVFAGLVLFTGWKLRSIPPAFATSSSPAPEARRATSSRS